MAHEYPILEYDSNPNAMIEPHRLLRPLDRMPEHCVLCFFQEVINAACAEAEQVIILRSEIGQNPIYVIEQNGQRVAVLHPGVGAPLAAGYLEEAIALGAKKFIACGGAGVLNKDLAVGHVVVPVLAIRDEGLSYHYLPPSRDVAASPEAIEALQQTLEAHHVPYVIGKTWTTDALYRETPGKVAHRRDEGCLTVEMEAAAFFAVAKFRAVTFGQILYSGDDLSGDEWDHRNWISGRPDTRQKLFALAVEACLKL